MWLFVLISRAEAVRQQPEHKIYRHLFQQCNGSSHWFICNKSFQCFRLKPYIVIYSVHANLYRWLGCVRVCICLNRKPRIYLWLASAKCTKHESTRYDQKLGEIKYIPPSEIRLFHVIIFSYIFSLTAEWETKEQYRKANSWKCRAFSVKVGERQRERDWKNENERWR